jgi:hypothetical protein
MASHCSQKGMGGVSPLPLTLREDLIVSDILEPLFSRGKWDQYLIFIERNLPAHPTKTTILATAMFLTIQHCMHMRHYFRSKEAFYEIVTVIMKDFIVCHVFLKGIPFRSSYVE